MPLTSQRQIARSHCVYYWNFELIKERHHAHVQKPPSQNVYSLSKTMDCGILTLWRQAVTMLLDCGRKYGVSFSHELSHFLIYFYEHGSRNRYKKHIFENPKQMYFNLPKIIFEVQVPFKISFDAGIWMYLIS